MNPTARRAAEDVARILLPTTKDVPPVVTNAIAKRLERLLRDELDRMRAEIIDGASRAANGTSAVHLTPDERRLTIRNARVIEAFIGDWVELMALEQVASMLVRTFLREPED